MRETETDGQRDSKRVEESERAISHEGEKGRVRHTVRETARVRGATCTVRERERGSK